jgi:toxin ParE1/3/4
MGQCVVTEFAKSDVRDIISDLSQSAGYAVAVNYTADFNKAYLALAQFPGSGAPRPKLGRNVRIKIVSPYLIIYLHDGDTATVLRVLHGKRNITRKLVKG